MRVCGIEIKSNEAMLCLLEKKDGLFQILDCRQTRVQLVKDHDVENMRKFQFTLQKLAEDYRINTFVIKERPQKGKFAGGAVGFKMEAAIQLIAQTDTLIMTGSEYKERIKRNPLPVDFESTDLRKFQEMAFSVAYAYLAHPHPLKSED